MITSIRMTEIIAKRGEAPGAQGFEVLFNVEDAKVQKSEVRIKFNYTANYKGSDSAVQIKGEITATEDKETIKKIEESLKGKRLPPDYMQEVVNLINYFGTANASSVALLLGMPAPIKMPVLRIEEAQKGKIGETAAKKQ